MSRSLIPLSLTATLMAGTAMSDVPRVAVDIAPVHSLVARVMDGVGAPNLIVPPGASPHEYNLRPSEAAALQDADLVFWLGEDLTPWMAGAVETLAGDADVTTLLETDATTLLSFREGALFEAHAHDAGEHGDEDHTEGEDHDHEEHAEGGDHGHEEHAEGEAHDHDDHSDATAHDHDHAHGERDPHAWLSPKNAVAWLNVIAGELSAADPDNAGAYFANAAAARSELEILSTEIDGILDPVRGGRFIAFHDAYQYFETAFDVPASGAISLSDASDPSPARIQEIQTRVRHEGIECVLAEPQFDPSIVETVMDGTEAKMAVLDPLGSDLEPGPDLYPQMMRNLATSLAGCL